VDTDTAQGVGRRAAPTSEVLDGLNDLLQLDHDAVGAYDIAIEKLDDRDHADQIAGFRRDHERHIRELNSLIAELGGVPKNEPHATGPFKEALQSLGGLAGDKGVLMAWRTNELQVRTKYDSYASKAMYWPDNVKRIVDQNALDEERHYRWVADVLQTMGIGAGEGMETDLASGLRERMNTTPGVGDRLRNVTDQTKERAGDLAETARMRLADGLESTAERLDQLADQQQGTGSGARERVGDVAHRIADRIESTAESLRHPSGQSSGESLEQRIREHPLQSLLVLFAAGFVVGRILR
jgi:ElaB/YqjD/DUF883 family membrane-anchored ribosome-binding protein